MTSDKFLDVSITAKMAPPNLLRQFRLTRNPFTDRTAEKTELDDSAIYKRSDLINFKPNDTTYVFFGRRGSGKTTIRLMMQKAYHNENSIPKGDSRGHYVIDLCTPGHMTACLSDFQVTNFISITLIYFIRKPLELDWKIGMLNSKNTGQVLILWTVFCLMP